MIAFPRAMHRVLIAGIGCVAILLPAFAESTTWQQLITAGRHALHCGDEMAAEKAFNRASELAYLSGVQTPAYATCLYSQAILFMHKGDFAKAEALLVKSLAIREKTLWRAHPDVIQTEKKLALVYDREKKPNEAINIRRQQLALEQDLFGENDPRVVDLRRLASSGQSQIHLNEPTGASAEIQAVGESAQLPGSIPVSLVRRDYENLASAKLDAAQKETRPVVRKTLLEESLRARQKVLQIKEKQSSDVEGLIAALEGVAETQSLMKQFGPAKYSIERAIDLQRTHYGEQRPRMRQLQLKYACILQQIGVMEMDKMQWTKAIDPLTRCWSLRRRGNGSPSELWQAGNSLAMCYMQTKQWRQAIEINKALEQIESRELNLTDKHVDTLHWIGYANYYLGDLPEAENFSVRASDLASHLLKPEDNLRLKATEQLGACYLAEGKYSLCKPIFEQNKIYWHRKHYRDQLQITLERLGEMYAKMGDKANSESAWREALTIWPASDESGKKQALQNLQAVLASEGKHSGADIGQTNKETP